jgi:hypothetical protein
MKTLVLLSGGMDSTYILWKLLTETDDEITALRVYTPEGYALTRPKNYWLESSLVMEKQAAPAVAARLADIRPFAFVEVPVTPTEADLHATRGHAATVQGAIYAKDNAMDRVCYGREGVHLSLGRGIPHWEERLALHNAIAPTVSFEAPLIDWYQCKAHGYQNLPADVISLTASDCRRAILVDGQYTFCNVCWGCRRKEDIETVLASGVTADAWMDRYLRLRGTGIYQGIITPDATFKRD